MARAGFLQRCGRAAYAAGAIVVACVSGPTALRPVAMPVGRYEPGIAPSSAEQSDPASVDPAPAGLAGVRALWLRSAPDGPRTYVLDVPARMPSATSTSRPLLLVHGLGDRGVRDFYPVLSQLAEARRVLAVGLPGIGRSELADAEPSPQHFAHTPQQSGWSAHVVECWTRGFATG